MSDLITNFVEKFATQYKSLNSLNSLNFIYDPTNESIKTQNKCKIILVHKDVYYCLSVGVSISSDSNREKDIYETTLTNMDSTTTFLKQIHSCQHFVGKAVYKFVGFIADTFNANDETEKKSQSDLFKLCIDKAKEMANSASYNGVFHDVSEWECNEEQIYQRLA